MWEYILTREASKDFARLDGAQKKVALDNEIKEINILNITKYGDPDDFQIPDIQEY